MSESVKVPFGKKPDETATLLLEAAEDLGLDPGVVKTTSRNEFSVPQAVNDKAFGKSAKKADAPAKQATAKKATARKSTAKKSTAKKAAPKKDAASTAKN